MLIVFAEQGLTIESVKEEPERLTIYISVPEDGYHRNVHGEVMAGKVLARRFKEVMLDMGAKRLTVKAKIRSGDIWTEEKAKTAELKMRKQLFGSQY